MINAGIFFNWKENSWVEASSGSKVTITDWYEGRPSNDTEANSCLLFVPYERRFWDVNCWYSGACPVCRMTKVRGEVYFSIIMITIQDFQLRGVCESSSADVFYHFEYFIVLTLRLLYRAMSRSALKLSGFYYSNMIFSPEYKLWKIVDLKNRTLAFTNDTLDIPVGTHKWYFLDSYCNDPGQHWRTLNLHQAIEQPGSTVRDDPERSGSTVQDDPEQQGSTVQDDPYLFILGHFCCGDGSCIVSMNVCDNVNHCQVLLVLVSLLSCNL